MSTNRLSEKGAVSEKGSDLKANHSSVIRRTWLLAVFTTTLVPLIAGGCGGYPPVSSEAFELAKAVSNLCNARSAEQIPMARRIIGERHDVAAITPRERQFLIEILDVAEGGDWDRAESQCRRLLADQTNW